MCGRFTLRTPGDVVARHFDLRDVPPLRPRFNVAPTQLVLAVRGQPAREAAMLVWGLVPSWAKDRTIGARLINARAETAAEKPAFRAALRSRRCLVAADGFYEWRRQGRDRQPFFFGMRDDRPFAFAGLWESWESPEGGPIESCAILTTKSNTLIESVHDRMPVILAEADYARWLDLAVHDVQLLLPLLCPYPAEAMTVHPVSPRVNRPANDDPGCIEPAE